MSCKPPRSSSNLKYLSIQFLQLSPPQYFYQKLTILRMNGGYAHNYTHITEL
jgi:hypothetical protein